MQLNIGRFGIIAALIGCPFYGVSAAPLTVEFGDTNRAPSGSLLIGGVTLSGTDFFGSAIGQPATAFGIGAGSATLGAIGTIDRQQHYSAGNGYSYSFVREGLSLGVDGEISSITILPYFSILGSGESLFLPFDISYYPHNTGGNTALSYWTLTSPDPLQINFQPGERPSLVDLGLISDFGNTPGFFPYLEAQGFPDITFEFGYSIKSIDYTPMSVPEPSPLAIVGLGLLGLLAARRSRFMPANQPLPAINRSAFSNHSED